MRLLTLSILFSLFFLASTWLVAGPVNINQADAGHLESELVGIGPDKAAAIVQYRQEKGPFASVDDLVKVKGIGAKTIEKNRENLTVVE